MNAYIGLTIGPIVKTIEKAKSTGELWGSSYLFSYIMKEIIREIVEEFKTDEDEKIIKSRFVVPNVVDSSIFDSGKKAGLFHDRFIFESKDDNDINRIKDVIIKVIDNLSEKIFKEIKDKNYMKTENKDRNSVLNYLKSFLKIYLVKVKVKDGESVILTVSNYLDALELRENYLEIEENDYIYYMFDKNNVKNTFLTEDAFKIENEEEKFKEIKKKLYPSLLRIATRELELPEDFEIDDNSNNDDDEKVCKFINSENFKQRDTIRKFHQYVALVQVDGDNMGKVIKNLADDKNCSKSKEFSKILFDYSKEAVELINKYGGFPIYAGGDDLLFLAPLRNIKSEEDKCDNIFQLFLKLDEKFNKNFEKYSEQKPSISIGMEVFNYKYPLYNALNEARMLLFEKAKEFAQGKNKKNALAFQVVKASGECFSATLSKNGKTYEKLCNIFESKTINNETKGMKERLNQIHIKLDKSEKIFEIIGEDKEKLNNYFDNNFNEAIHMQDDIQMYIETIKDFIYTVYCEYDKDKAMKIIYSCLKFISFMYEKSALIEERGGKNE